MDVESQAPVTPVASRFSVRRVGEFLLSLPPVSKWLVFITITLYFLGLIITLNEALALVPGNLMPPRVSVWTLITSSFYHLPGDFLELALNLVIIIVLGGGVLEPLWGTWEMSKFLAIVLFCSSVGAFILRILLFLVTSNFQYLFAPVGGFFGGSVAFLVALKQLNPEKEWSYFNLSIRAKHLPLLVLLFSLTVELLLFDTGSFSFGFVGLLSSWVYLRWFQERPGNVTGDPSDEFKFSTFFPEQMHSFIDSLGRCCFCCAKSKPQPRGSTNFNSVLDSPEDAERRRRVALKALDETLAKKVSAVPTLGTVSTPPTVSSATTTTSITSTQELSVDNE